VNAVALSFVIPLYRSADTIGPLVRAIEALHVDGGHEIILVNDGSRDRTSEVCRALVRDARIPITLIEHARNYGEHNAVLSGWRRARGAHIVNLDDDGQHPPGEAVRLWMQAKETGLDVIFGHYREKQHSAFRNFGSWFTNRMTDWALDKPQGFYLSSFRCVTAFVARQVVTYAGPYPYIDGLLLQVTQRIGSIEVRHEERKAGQSGYTLGRLIQLWLSAWVNFSLLPLRIATLLGLLLGGAGLLALVVLGWLWIRNIGPSYGFGWLMGALLVFSGTQLVLLGLIGEYVGRMFLTVNQRPQSVVREVLQSAQLAGAIGAGASAATTAASAAPATPAAATATADTAASGRKS
jgi:undecaprenyl-phosphate 4-deoxy-4-formamido-L-arabinose transferase